MPVIPVYDAKATLDPDQAPHPQFDASAERAAAGLGQAMQGFGGAVSELGAHIEQKQQQEAAFSTGLQQRALQQDLQGVFDQSTQAMSADGSGFAKGFLAQADQAAEQRFAAMPAAGQARDRARQEWQAYGREVWGNRAVETQYKAQGAFSTYHIGQMQDGDLQAVSMDPSRADSLLEQARSQIQNAPGLTAAQKLVALEGYQRQIYGTQLATQYANDPDGMRMALGISAPGTAGSTFTRMLRAESGGNPAAVSPKGALGIAQVMPGTAREVADTMGLHTVAGMSDAELKTYFAANPEVNQRIGRTYFNQMLARYHGDQEAAVIAYNSGPGRADDWLRKGKDDDVLPKETIDYRNKVLGAPGSDHPDFQEADTTEPVPSSKGGPAGIGSDAVASVSPGAAGAALVPYLVNQRSPASVLQLNPVFTSRIQQALANAPPEIQQATRISSGFRSDDHQAELYSAAVQKYGSEAAARKWVAPPGHSNHNAGQAMDLSYKSDAARQWWHDNADRFGLKFPLSNENWHIEPKETRGGGTLASGALPTGGGVLNPKYASLSFADTQRLVAGAEAGLRRLDAAQQQQLKLDSFNTSRLVDDDIQSLSATGQGVSDLDPGRVAAVLGPDKAQRWQEQRGQALDVYKGTAGMDAMTNDQLEQHAEQFRPGEGDTGEGYGGKAAVYRAVHDHAQAVLKQRVDDPASAVASAPNVKAAVARIGGGDTSVAAHENLIQARLAAQEAVGISKSERSPIPIEEARLYGAKMRALTAGQAQAADQAQVIDDIVTEIGAKYGRYAPDVLKRIMWQVTMKKATSDVLTKALLRAQAGGPGALVTSDEAGRVRAEQQADALARQSGAVASPSASGPPPQAAAGIAAPDGSIMRSYDPRESFPASFEGASTSMLDAPPARRGSYLDAVDALQKDPDRMLPFFVQRYGADRVPANLRGRTGAQAR